MRYDRILFIVSIGFLCLSGVRAQVEEDGESNGAVVTSAPTETTSPESELAAEEEAARFDRILQRRPFHKSAFTGLVRHYLNQGRLDELVSRYEARMAALPDDVPTKVVAARLFLRTGKTDRALELLGAISASGALSERDESQLLVFRSEVFQKVNRLEEAEEQLQLALERARSASERMTLSESLADLHLRAGDREKAAAVLTGLAEQYADSYLHRRRIADALAQRDLHEAAVAQYEALVEATSADADRKCEVLRQLGRSLEKLDRTQDAIHAYSDAIALLTGDHWLQEELHQRIVTLYRQSGRLDDLIAYCRERIEKSPEQSQMRMLLADVQAAMDDKDGAKTTLEEATTLFPKDITLSERRISMLERFDEKDGVVAEYERIISQHPDDVELYVAYGQFLAAHRDLDAARGQWKRVLKSGMTDATLARRLGSYFEPYEMFDDAAECYERAIELAPKTAEGYEALSRLYRLQGELEKSVAAAKRMGDAAPEDPYVQAVMSRTLASAGAMDESLVAMEKACALKPQEVRYQLERADLLVRLGRVEDALKARRDALSLMPSDRQRAAGVDILVSMHATANRIDALIEDESARLRDSPDDETSLLILARAADYRRDFRTARERLEQLLALNPAHEEARRQLARLFEAIGDVDAAVAQYTRLIEGHPERGRDYYQSIADLRLRYDDKGGAVRTFEAMVEASPNNATVLKSVAEQMARLGEIERALTYFETATRLQPDRYELHLAYADALAEAGRLEDAMKTYRVASIQRSDRDTAATAIGKLHDVARRLGEVDDLIVDLQARAEADPEDTLVARTLAQLLIQEYEYNRAIDWLAVVIRYNPRDVDLQMARAEILRRLARFDEAAETYRRVMRFPGVDRDYVLGELGKCFFEAGSVDEAKSAWRQIANKLYAGTLLKGNGLFDEAIAVFREGIRMKPDAFELHRQLVATLERSGRTDEALEAARRLLDLEPDNIRNIEQLAKAYIDKGDRRAAAEIAGRLFSAGVGNKQNPGAGSSPGGGGGFGSIMMASMQASWGGGGQAPRSNLDRAVAFFTENGLLTELKETLDAQLESQPDNAVLKLKAYEVFEETFSESEKALALLQALETATFPLEHQTWLGQSSQRDYFRVRAYSLIAQKPALRDARLAELEAKGVEALDRDEIIELAVIRQAQGANNEAAEMLGRAVNADDTDLVALSGLVDILLGAERYKDAEPHARRLATLLNDRREALEKEMVERARRDFVRSLPIRFQLRLTEELLADIAHKWALGEALVSGYSGTIRTAGHLRAQLNLATILAKTDRIEEARTIWKSLEPGNPADADGWTMLAGIAQLHEQNDLAYEWYEKSLIAVRRLAGDQLLQRIYSGTLTTSWYGEQEGIDSAFNAIVKAFAERDKLVELYDFLRETDQTVRARRIAEQYKMVDTLKGLYAERVESAREAYRRSSDDRLTASVPYFAEVCKLAELYDRDGDWPEARKIYAAYLDEFPSELGLLQTLGEVAEAQEEYADALALEQKVVASKERLARDARNWSLRNVAITPDIPRILESAGQDTWSWQQRWGRMNVYWGWGGMQNPLELWPSWIRIARLHLSLDNTIAAGDALERAVGVAGVNQDRVGDEVLALIRQRKLVKELLPVLRSLAVGMPTNESVQIAFAESLEANDRAPVAIEVYQRLLRRGLADVGRLAQVRRRLEQLQPPTAVAESTDTIESLRATLAASPDNARNKMRLARALYYSLEIDEALKLLEEIAEKSPHMEGLHELLVEIHTIRNEPEKLIEALRQQIDRAKDDDAKRTPRYRLVEALLAAGRRDEALEALGELANPRDPSSYERVGILLHYYGRHEAALEKFEAAKRSKSGGGGWGGAGETGDAMIARSLLIKGDVKGAADRIVSAVSEQMRQSTQYGGMMSMYGMYNDDDQNHFQPFSALFVMRPALAKEIRDRLEAEYASSPDDPLAAKRLLMLHKTMGRPDLADRVLEKLIDKSMSDQALAMRLIDRAIERREYEKAVSMAREFIDNQPKPQVPPGMPPQYAGMIQLMSARNMMTCRLGDIYWKMNQPDKAFEEYNRIRDEKVDLTNVAYAAICVIRGRVEEAKTLLDQTLAAQDVDSPLLLQFRAVIAVLDDDTNMAFDLLEQAAKLGEGDQSMMTPFGGGGGDPSSILGSLAEATGLFDRYVEFLRDRIKKNPNDWSNHQELAALLRRHGRYDDALAVLNRAAKVKALRRQVMSERVQWMEGFASDEELIAAYREVIEALERKVEGGGSSIFSGLFSGRRQSTEEVPTQNLRDRLGHLLWRRGEHEEAEKVWKERMNLKEAGSHITLGNRFLELRAYPKAKAEFEEALRLDPTNTPARKRLTIFAFAEKDAPGALAQVRELFEREAVGEDDNDPYRRYYGQMNRSDGVDVRSAMAVAASDPTTAEAIQKTLDDDQDARLAVSALVGDWEALESDLDVRRKASPYDPQIHTLWAKLLERKGEWSRAAEAWEYVRRLKRTSLPDRMDQLKLVLAGKQIRNAAAGITQAPQGPASAAMMGISPAFTSSYGRYGGYYWGAPDDDLRHLASIYVKLGEYEKAERAYLISSQGGSPQSMLPMLAGLMWRQDAGPRALELMELSLLFADDINQISQYAELLDRLGRTEDAMELLSRGYRSLPDEGNDYYYYSMWGMYGGREEPEFESWQESQIAETLCDMAERTGKIDAILEANDAELKRDAGDARLAKLTLSLQIRDHRWKAARDTLIERRKSLPEDNALRSELMQAEMQLENWDGAMAMLAELKEALPEMAEQYRMKEAFVEFMRKNSDESKRLMAGIAEESPVSDEDDMLQWRLLGASALIDDVDGIITHLERARDRKPLDDTRASILYRAYLRVGRRADAARLAIDRLWASTEAITPESPWFERLYAVAEVGECGILKIDIPNERPEDAALVSLLHDSAQEGARRFLIFIEEDPENVKARRGLALAAQMGLADRSAVDVNAEFVEWLSARRRSLWRTTPSAPLQEKAKAYLENMRKGQVGAAGVLSMNSSMLSYLNEIVGNQNNGGIELYEPLWASHERLQADLLAKAGDVDGLVERLKTQAALVNPDQSDDGMFNDMSMFMSGANAARIRAYMNRRSSSSGEFASDWREAAQKKFVEIRAFDRLLDELADTQWRLPRETWPMFAEWCAAADRPEDAAGWKRRMIAAAWAALEANDLPSIDPDADDYSWYWGGFGGDRTVNEVRSALRSCQSRLPDELKDDPEEEASDVNELPDEIWEWALLDPEIESRLTAMADLVGPGWEKTKTVEALISLYRAKRRPADIVALIEKMGDADAIVKSARFRDYLNACFDLGDFDRIDRAVSAANAVSPELQNECDMVRLVVARKRGDTASADSLEASLIERCHSESPAIWRVDSWLMRTDESLAESNYVTYNYSNRYISARYYGGGVLQKVAAGRLDRSAVAQLFGAEIRDDNSDGDITLEWLQYAYQMHHCYDDAIRIMEMRIDRYGSAWDEEEFANLNWRKAQWLTLAGRQDEARKLLADVEEYWLSRAVGRPFDAGPMDSLAAIYASRAYGQDYKKAQIAIDEARLREPMSHRFDASEALYFFKLGDWERAWRDYRRALERGAGKLESVTDYYRAGLSACRAGATEAGESLLRQALWRDPLHGLAAQARELTNEKSIEVAGTR